MRNVLVGFGAIALFTVAGHAQTPQAQVDPMQVVTVTGCVQNERDVLKIPSVSGKTGMSDEFVLTHSMIRTAAPAMEPPATPEPTATADAGKIYRMSGDQEASLKPHLNHKVEITGTFKSPADARRELGAVGTSGKPPATAIEPTAMNTPEIAINSIRMLSDTCGG